MGRAKRNPSWLPPRVRDDDGFRFRSTHPTGTPLRHEQNRVPAPQPVVGQPRAAPPAVDRVVPAEIFSAGQNGLAERGERQPAFLVSLVSFTLIVHLQRERPLREARHSRVWSERKAIQERANFPIVEHAALKALLEMRKHLERMYVAGGDQLQNSQFRRAKSASRWRTSIATPGNIDSARRTGSIS